MSMPVKTQQAINKYFPGALTGRETEEAVFEVLKQHGITEDNTIFTDCSCPDEINHDDPEEDVCMLFQKRYKNVFPLSGLGGLPFTGKTGWHAMSSHVPDDGHIVVLVGPHVGIDCEGNVGKVNRKGQANVSSACGAAIGALAALQAGEKTNFKNGYQDHQMDCVKHLLEPHVKDIEKCDNQQAALAYKMFDVAEKFLDDVIHLNWQGPNSKLSIIGGIMINCDEKGSDRFLPLKFVTRTKTQETDLYEKVFGYKPKVF